jgi:hypothetical protein
MPTYNFTTTDKTIRKILLSELGKKYKSDSDTAIIPEFSLPNGSARIDIAVVNGIMHGYELKSDLDTLTRLQSQMHAYNSIFDKVTLVVGKRHIIEALHIIPQWWGITIASVVNDEQNPHLIPIRKPHSNPTQDILTLVNMLWKDEALDILSRLGMSKNLSAKPKKIICEKLIEWIEPQALKSFVRKSLVERVRLQVV